MNAMADDYDIPPRVFYRALRNMASLISEQWGEPVDVETAIRGAIRMAEAELRFEGAKELERMGRL